MKVKWQQVLTWCVSAPWFSYLTIILLQLKVIWRMWEFRELTIGDTSYYFLNAADWHRGGLIPFAWSPVYTSFFGTFLYFTQDAFAAVTAHRFVIVMVLAPLVLALMRRLLPPAIAWGAAAWWVLMPINFNALYEIHLFVVIPMILALLALAAGLGEWSKGAALGILLASSILVRNELLLATGLFALCIVADTIRTKAARRAFPPYVVPIVLVLAVTGYYKSRSSETEGEANGIESKKNLVVCQMLSVGYVQRHPEFKKPAGEGRCEDMMIHVFGIPEPTVWDAIRLNPLGLMEHFAWNVYLTNFGLQVLLFNVSAGEPTPDYVAVIRAGPIVWVPSIALLLLIAAGIRRMAADRKYWLDSWLPGRGWLCVAFACLSVMVAAIILLNRPRPSYMFILGLGLRALAGMSLYALIRQTSLLDKIDRWFPASALLLIAIVPPLYPLAMSGWRREYREQYWRLKPHQQRIESPEVTITGSLLYQETCNYLLKRSHCYPQRSEVGLDELLQVPGVNMIYFDRPEQGDPLLERGWRELAGSRKAGESWSLIVRTR
jgi:hypothetical protein